MSQETAQLGMLVQSRPLKPCSTYKTVKRYALLMSLHWMQKTKIQTQEKLLAHPITCPNFQTLSAKSRGRKAAVIKDNEDNSMTEEAVCFFNENSTDKLNIVSLLSNILHKHTVGFQQALPISPSYCKSKGKTSFNDSPLSQKWLIFKVFKSIRIFQRVSIRSENIQWV